jgi:hypothetical protein
VEAVIARFRFHLQLERRPPGGGMVAGCGHRGETVGPAPLSKTRRKTEFPERNSGGPMSFICCSCGAINHADTIVARWLEQCRNQGWTVKAGRVTEATAAMLLGISARQLAELRKRDCGPVVSTLPVSGSRYSYELEELASFKEAQRMGEDWDAAA